MLFLLFRNFYLWVWWLWDEMGGWMAPENIKIENIYMKNGVHDPACAIAKFVFIFYFFKT